MPGLINSINANIHVGVGTRLFDLAYLLGVSAPFPWSRTHSNISILPYTVLYSSLWHRPSISRSRDFFLLMRRCLITQSWSRRRSHTTGAFPAAMKRRTMFIGLTNRPLHRISEIRAKIWARRFSMCLRVWNAWHFEFGRSQSERETLGWNSLSGTRLNLTANI